MKISIFLCALAAALLVVFSLSNVPAARADGSVPAVGTPAPGFTLDSQEGKPVDLDEFRGKWVVLYFYPKDFTKGCTIEAHNFQKSLAKIEKRNAVVVGVSVQSSGSHKDFCAKESLGFKLLADVDRKVSTAYGSTMEHAGAVLSARNTFLIGPDGVIRKEFIKVDPAKHDEEVLAALADLQKPSAPR